MRRSLLAAAIATALLTTQNVQALGLGEAEVQSFLNQPLRVRIPVIVENEGERESLRIDLAEAEDFRRVGLDRAALGLSLDVELEETANGLFVTLSSIDSVRDPFLQVLLNADWSSGRMLRQYTLFLDPPLLETPSIQVRNEPPPAPAASDRGSTSRATRPADRRGTTATRPSISGDEYGPVSAGETLWSIASRSNPNTTDYSVNQVMLAYVRLNPDAFDQGNVNSLRRGTSLRVPSTEDIAVVNAQEALRIVQQQHREWRSNGFGFATDEATSDTGSRGSNRNGSRADGSSSRDAPDGRLQLVPPEESSDPVTNSAGMRAELARLEEELLTARLENADLVEQVENLRQQIASLEGQGVQDRGLAEFQNYLAEQQAGDDPGEEAYVDPFVNQGFDDGEAVAGDTGASDVGASDAGAGDTGVAATAGGSDQSTAGNTAANQVAQDNTPPPVAMDAPPASAAAAATSDSGSSFFSPLTLFIAGIGALGVGFLLWMQRRRDQSKGDERKPEQPDKSRFSAKGMLAGKKGKADKKDTTDKKKGKGGAASLADRLIQASRQQDDDLLQAGAAVAGAAATGAAAADVFDKHPTPRREPEPEPKPKPEPAPAAPPAAEEPVTSAYDEPAYDEPQQLMTREEPAEEATAAVEEEDAGLDFVLDDERTPASTLESDDVDEATEDLLRRLAEDEDQPEPLAESGTTKETDDDGLDFDLSGMEHLMAGEEPQQPEVEVAEQAQEDAYDSVLRMAAADEEDELPEAAGSMAGPDEDEVEIKLDLARAYISMGDNEAAGTILDEILTEGSDAQRAEARNLLKQI